MDTPRTISDAEWQVMRIIWEESPITSTSIIDKLSATSDWTPATIRTLLGRLVGKEAISFKKEGRAFYYFPLLTEEECLQTENRLFIEKVYGANSNYETKHFIFYGINLESYIAQLAETLEINFDRILKNLQYSLPDKITVYIHPDLKHFHKAMGVIDAPDWFRASFSGGILNIVPPEYFIDLPADKVALHVLSQIVIHRINFDVPVWLYQGVSAYEGKWLEKSWIKIALARRLTTGDIPSFYDMDTGFRAFGDNEGYLFSYTIADFIITRYGYWKLNEVIRNPHDFAAVFSKSVHDLHEEWVQFLKENYCE